MGLKPNQLAGWCLFVVLLFLSVFYLLAGHLLSMPASWGARVSVVLAEGTAFLGAAAGLRLISRDRKLFRRLRPVSNVYYSFSLLLSLTAGLFLFLLQPGFSRLMHTSHWGLSALYPTLVRSPDVPFLLSFVTLVLIPALSQELLLRGGLFSIFEEQGTAYAVVFSTVCMPLLYLYPSAAVPSIAIGLLCSAETYYTGSVWPAVLTHLFCRLGLYCSDLLFTASGIRTELVIAVAGVLFLLCLFSFLRSCEGLLRDGLLEHFQKPEDRSIERIWTITRTPGALLFLILYMVRLVLTLHGLWR